MTRECRHTLWQSLTSTPLSDREMSTLTLWQQRKKSRQFPVTLGFNLLILLLCVTQCLMVSLEYTNYNRGNENGFRNTFHPEELRDGLFSIQEVMEVLEDMVEKVHQATDDVPSIERVSDRLPDCIAGYSLLSSTTRSPRLL